MIIWMLLACSEPNDTAEACIDAPTYDEWTKGFMSSKCQSCHATTARDRYSAPEEIYFDTYEDVFHSRDLIRSSVLDRRSMPPSGGVLEDELTLLEQWLDCPQ